MLRDLWITQFARDRPWRPQSPLFIGTHQRAVAGNIGCESGCELAARPQEISEPVAAQLQPGIGHGVAACRRDEGRLMRRDLGLRTRIHRASTSQLAAALPCTLSDLPTPNYTTAGVRKGPGGTTQWKRSGCWHSPTG
jgi:hypothetical protein